MSDWKLYCYSLAVWILDLSDSRLVAYETEVAILLELNQDVDLGSDSGMSSLVAMSHL